MCQIVFCAMVCQFLTFYHRFQLNMCDDQIPSNFHHHFSHKISSYCFTSTGIFWRNADPIFSAWQSPKAWWLKSKAPWHGIDWDPWNIRNIMKHLPKSKLSSKGKPRMSIINFINFTNFTMNVIMDHQHHQFMVRPLPRAASAAPVAARWWPPWRTARRHRPGGVGTTTSPAYVTATPGNTWILCGRFCGILMKIDEDIVNYCKIVRQGPRCPRAVQDSGRRSA